MKISPEGEVLPETALTRMTPASIVRPAVNPEEAIEAWHQYEALKKAIITSEDKQTLHGRDFLKKSYWRKCATFFNLTLEIESQDRVIEDDGSITFEVVYRATAPNGRMASGDGACNSHEKKDRQGNLLDNSIHNTRGTAHTRAFNRAVSNLVGGGEVSAEEADQDFGIPLASTGRSVVKQHMNPSSSVKGGEFRFAFGKYKGQSFAEIAPSDLTNYLGWLSTQHDPKNEYIFQAFDTWSAQASNEIPPISDLDLPFEGRSK